MTAGKDRVLALDIGASKLVLAEFSAGRSGMPALISYGVGYLGVEPDQDADASAFIVSTIRDIIRENNIKPASLLMTVSGQAVFPRYVKLPPVAKDKIVQIIQYEAEQNVPFPIEEVVWDYQIISTDSDGNINVMLTAAKIENVKRLTDCVQAVGLEPEIVDVATMALYNCVRYNYPNLEGCTMVLDMGARSSSLIFVEENLIFSRSIPVAGNAITQELMKEFDLSFKDAEELKKAHGFVALGGVSAVPEGEVSDRVSKIIRNVLTRLHAEVNRSINFYRSQQGGNPPGRVLLTGGSSIIPHTDTFFREKLKVDVEYMNPFGNITVGSAIKADRIAGELHLLGEVAGLALRKALKCPVELNLMPPDLVATKVFRRRQPFFVMAAVSIVLILLCWTFFTLRIKNMRERQDETVRQRINALNSIAEQLGGTDVKKADVRTKADTLTNLIGRRTEWLEILDTIHSCMLDGMWLASLQPVLNQNGNIGQLRIGVSGFDDKLKVADEQNRTAFEYFRDRLRESGRFGKTTEIEAYSPMPRGAFARECTIRIDLNNEILLSGVR